MKQVAHCNDRKRPLSPETSSSSSSTPSSSSSSNEHASKKMKADRRLEKAQKVERKAQGQLQKFSDKLYSRLGKFIRSHKKRRVAAHAFLFFVLEWINRINSNPDDLKLRRLPTDSRSYRYVTNVKKGDRILAKLGAEPGANSWILKNDKLELLQVAEGPLEKALKQLTVDIRTAHHEPMGTPKKILGKRKAPLSPYESKVVGSVLAHTCGDILGAPVEGWRAEVIGKWFCQLNEFQDLPHNNDAPGGFGVYTADTELMFVTAKSIVKREIFDVKTLAEEVAGAFSKGRARSYPETMSVLLPRLADGLDYRKSGSYLSAEGHVHNEGLSRMLPIALTFRNAPDEVLLQAVQGASLFSTVHPSAVSSYFAYTKSITLMLAQADLARFDAAHWLQDILKASQNNDVRSRIQLILRDLQPLGDGQYRVPAEVVDHLSDPLQSEAVEMLSLVLCIVCEFWRTPVEAVLHAVHTGGDANTLGCCVGSLMGALHGYSWIPKKWYKNIENEGEEGRDQIVRTALLLSAYDFFKPGHVKNNAAPLPYKAGLYNYQAAVKIDKKFGAKETIYSYG